MPGKGESVRGMRHWIEKTKKGRREKRQRETKVNNVRTFLLNEQ